jgi:hypothetical protein
MPTLASLQFHPIHRARHCSHSNVISRAAILASVSEPVAAKCVSYPGTARAVKVRAPIRYSSQPRSGEIPMTITVAHISPIISLIAGLLILIMPRLLNLVVAIYLILNGLIGLGLLKWLHM